MICVIIPIRGRLSLMAWTLDRLLNNGYKVVCIGNDYDSEDLAMVMGADWIHHPNFPLGMKYNVAWEYAMRKYDPDYYVMGNVSDWYGYGLIEDMISQIGGYQAIGITEKWYYNLGRYGNRLCHMDRVRMGGSGFVVSREAVLEWGGRPFNDAMDTDLDWSILDNLKGKVATYNGKKPLMSISFYKWANAYNFEAYWNKGIMMNDGRDFLREHFRDAIDMTLW